MPTPNPGCLAGGCEVKGPGDRLRESQAQYFQALQEVSGKPVYLIKARFAPFEMAP